MLAVLPNAPGLISPDSHSRLLTAKRNRLLKKLLEMGVIDAESYQLALLEEVPPGSRPFRMSAPHLSQWLKDSYAKNGGIIRTTINAPIQQWVEDLVKQHLHYLESQGIRNGAVLVAETKSGKIRAYVGSQDFWDSNNLGQVDGVRAPRSSGSILKPFLYALSIDEGLILPQTVLKDVPTYFGAFSPSNASGTYSGMVTAKHALVHSLNVPAVRLLNRYGLHDFYSFLKTAGITTLFRTADDYGLPLILGGAEVTLWDMARLYRGLGNRGQFDDLIILSDNRKPGTAPAGQSSAFISPMSCYLTLNMLSDLARPGSEYYWEQYQDQRRIAWKTGTSYGQRDAWAIGVSPQWTIAVWVGNFDGEGNANLMGSRCAGPLLFDIFNTLPASPELSWFPKPEDGEIQPVTICSETGYRAGNDCPNTIIVEAPRFMKPLKVCPYHKRLYVSGDERFQVCSLCWKNGDYHAKSFLVYPPDVAQYLRQQGQIVTMLPPHKPDCPAQSDENPLTIVYPGQNAHLWLPRDFGGTLQKVILRAAHRLPHTTVFWYLDNSYLGETSERHELAAALTAGWHTLKVIDETGKDDLIRFYVEMQRLSE